MKTIEGILSCTSHRPFKIPNGNWMYYQEWNRALFLHWKIPYEILRNCVPASLNIDTFEGDCYVSLVAFTMEKIRPRFLPSIGCISNFDEINVRTYIDNDNKKGVYFLNIEAGKFLSSFIAKTISGLPYQTANIERMHNVYKSTNNRMGLSLNTAFEVKEKITDKTLRDTWLTERYCLYLDNDNNHYRYDIHHEEWTLNHVNLNSLTVHYKLGALNLSDTAPIATHYSHGIKVLAWQRQKLY